MKTLVSIQDQYIATINAGAQRWGHRRNGGHYARIYRGARHKAERELRRLQFSDEQISQVIRDAKDMAELMRHAEEE